MYTLESIHLRYTWNDRIAEVRLDTQNPVYTAEHLSFSLDIHEALSGQRWTLKANTRQPIELLSLEISASEDYDRCRSVFCNGFQSWSESRLYRKDEKMPYLARIARFIMRPYGDYTYHNYAEKPGVLHSWGYTYFVSPNKRVQFIGSLDEKNAFTNFIHYCNDNRLIISRDVKGWEINGETTLADYFQTDNTERGAFQHYFMLCEYPELKVAPAIGWTSWYHYYTTISEKIILDNLKAFSSRKLPLDIFQIDDGYQERVGDWLDINKKFPNGMKYIADQIKAAGYRPGLWLAPLAAEKKSRLFREHPDWFMKDENGKPYRIGINPLWSMAFYALDIYHPEVRTYIKKVFQVVCREWGFDVVKLDFLYGACLVARNGRSRGGVMQDAMELLREAIGEDKQILGCGIPLGTAPGITDYCRIGADVHLTWDMKILKWCHNRERVSTALAITNTINRRQLNRQAFINDPDVFMLRRKRQRLNKAEQYSLLLANVLFGDLLFNSDNINDYDEATLQLYLSIFPLVRRKEVIVEHTDGLYKIFFQVGDRRYMGFINLSEQNKLYKLPDGIYFEPTHQEILTDEQTLSIPKHQSILLHICSNGPFGVLGSKGHFFPGAEISKIALHGADIHVQLLPGLQVDPVVFLKVPKDFSGETINGKPFRMVQKREFAVIYTQLQRDETK